MNGEDCFEILENSGRLGQQLKQNSVPVFWNQLNMNRMLSSLAISPTTCGLATLLLATLATVGNLPSVENSTMSNFATMTKKRMKSVSRSMFASSG